MRYNKFMEKYKVIIIGGGAVGLTCAASLHIAGKDVLLLERGERLGRKLAATGNGQGNVSNLSLSSENYFSTDKEKNERLDTLFQTYGIAEVKDFYASLGVFLLADERGRVYPSGRQASALSDALRFCVQDNGITVRLNRLVTDVEKAGTGFIVTAKTLESSERFFAENVLVCTGGKAAKNFGTDGAGYVLTGKFGHTCTPLYPSLVQLKCDVKHTKTLKGIRVNDARVSAYVGDEKLTEVTGDLIFTDYGVSGDAIFRISAFLADKIDKQVRLSIDLLPALSKQELRCFLQAKKKNCPNVETSELLGGVLNNQVGRAVIKRYGGDLLSIVEGVKNFTLEVTGSLGFDYAQVTKGGVPFNEVDDSFQSKRTEGLYLAGELLDIDGECGGYNLHFAFACARVIANALNQKLGVDRGQV